MTDVPARPGPLMADIEGTELRDEERRFLAHPSVGGVILFARNYRDPEQLRSLSAQLHAVRNPPLLIAVDHEGGRVQRFREGFTAVPSMKSIGQLWGADRASARRAAWAVGTVIGCELRSHGVDLSFAPVLDLEYGASTVIGDRALHADPWVVAELAGELVAGLASVGVPAVGKHFPGHGFIGADSHVAVPVDARPLEEILASDILPYRLLAHRLGGVMPAHVIYERCDSSPAGFSAFWLDEILRRQLGFRGVVFSDDLSMEGASVAGGPIERANAALSAGCDMVLLCNSPDAARRLVREWVPSWSEASASRVSRMSALREGMDVRRLCDDERYAVAREIVAGVAAAAAHGAGCVR